MSMLTVGIYLLDLCQISNSYKMSLLDNIHNLYPQLLVPMIATVCFFHRYQLVPQLTQLSLLLTLLTDINYARFTNLTSDGIWSEYELRHKLTLHHSIQQADDGDLLHPNICQDD